MRGLQASLLHLQRTRGNDSVQQLLRSGWIQASLTGQFQPATSTGRKLLAHELAHVEQQTSAGTTRSGLETSDVIQTRPEESPALRKPRVQ